MINKNISSVIAVLFTENALTQWMTFKTSAEADEFVAEFNRTHAGDVDSKIYSVSEVLIFDEPFTVTAPEYIDRF